MTSQSTQQPSETPSNPPRKYNPNTRKPTPEEQARKLLKKIQQS